MDRQGQGSPGALTPLGFPDVTKFGIPTVGEFLPGNQQDQKEKKETRHQDVKSIYRDLISKGVHPKDAAKQAQAMTGHSAVTGQPIKREPKFSKKKKHNVIGQYGTSGKSKFGVYG